MIEKKVNKKIGGLVGVALALSLGGCATTRDYGPNIGKRVFTQYEGEREPLKGHTSDNPLILFEDGSTFLNWTERGYEYSISIGQNELSVSRYNPTNTYFETLDPELYFEDNPNVGSANSEKFK